MVNYDIFCDMTTIIKMNCYKYDKAFTEDYLSKLRSATDETDPIKANSRLIYILYHLVLERDEQLSYYSSIHSKLRKETDKIKMENQRLRDEIERYKSMNCETGGFNLHPVNKSPAYKERVTALQVKSLLDEGKKISEIALELGISRGTVYSRINELKHAGIEIE